MYMFATLSHSLSVELPCQSVTYYRHLTQAQHQHHYHLQSIPLTIQITKDSIHYWIGARIARRQVPSIPKTSVLVAYMY
jgi:hypothetical protein